MASNGFQEYVEAFNAIFVPVSLRPFQADLRVIRWCNAFDLVRLKPSMVHHLNWLGIRSEAPISGYIDRTFVLREQLAVRQTEGHEVIRVVRLDEADHLQHEHIALDGR